MYLFWCKNPKYQINNYFSMQENLENLIDISLFCSIKKE